MVASPGGEHKRQGWTLEQLLAKFRTTGREVAQEGVWLPLAAAGPSTVPLTFSPLPLYLPPTWGCRPPSHELSTLSEQSFWAFLSPGAPAVLRPLWVSSSVVLAPAESSSFQFFLEHSLLGPWETRSHHSHTSHVTELLGTQGHLPGAFHQAGASQDSRAHTTLPAAPFSVDPDANLSDTQGNGAAKPHSLSLPSTRQHPRQGCDLGLCPMNQGYCWV